MGSKTLNKYRLWCETEERPVYTWAEREPTQCPNGAEHVLGAGSVVELERVSESVTHVSNLPLSPFDRLLTAEDTLQLNLKPGCGISALRDEVRTANGGTVSNAINAPEYTFSVSGPGSMASMRSLERGRYVTGLAAEVGIGGHLVQLLQDDQRLRYGLFDESNGFFFEITAAGLSVAVMKEGIIECTSRQSFNMDSMDGNGPSGHVMNPLKGYIWIIRFSWYGYGMVEFSVVAEDARQQQRTINMHRYYPQTRPSTSMPNLPINVELDAGERGGACTAYVTGRKFSVLGKSRPMTRTGSAIRIVSDLTASGWVPVMSIRSKQEYLVAPVLLNEIEVFGTIGTGIFKVLTGTTLPEDSVWGAPPCYESSETAVEYCELPETATGGICIWKAFIRNVNIPAHNTQMDFYLTDHDSVTVYVKHPAELGTLHVAMRWEEEW